MGVKSRFWTEAIQELIVKCEKRQELWAAEKKLYENSGHNTSFFMDLGRTAGGLDILNWIIAELSRLKSLAQWAAGGADTGGNNNPGLNHNLASSSESKYWVREIRLSTEQLRRRQKHIKNVLEGMQTLIDQKDALVDNIDRGLDYLVAAGKENAPARWKPSMTHMEDRKAEDPMDGFVSSLIDAQNAGPCEEDDCSCDGEIPLGDPDTKPNAPFDAHTRGQND